MARKWEKSCRSPEWWDSLSLDQKQAEIKKLEEEWIKKAGGNDFEGYVGDGSSDSQITFKNGRLHVFPEDLSKIPPPLLEKFGVQVYTRFGSSISDVFPGYNQDLDTKIKTLKTEIEKARKSGNQQKINSLESELQKLLTEKSSNHSVTRNSPNKSLLAIWIVISTLLLLLAGIIFVVVKIRSRKHKRK